MSLDTLLSGKEQPLYVGVDGGGSKTEFVLFEQNGTVRNVIFMEGSNPNDNGIEKSLQVLGEGLERVLQRLQPEAVFAGIAGASFILFVFL